MSRALVLLSAFLKTRLAIVDLIHSGAYSKAVLLTGLCHVYLLMNLCSLSFLLSVYQTHFDQLGMLQ